MYVLGTYALYKATNGQTYNSFTGPRVVDILAMYVDTFFTVFFPCNCPFAALQKAYYPGNSALVFFWPVLMKAFLSEPLLCFALVCFGPAVPVFVSFIERYSGVCGPGLNTTKDTAGYYVTSVNTNCCD